MLNKNKMTKQVLLGSTYLGPIQYYQKIINSEQVTVEQYDNYTKQSFRNRCDILSANGKISLTIPVVKGREHKKWMKDIEIAYHQHWQDNHWKALITAYKNSPYFEYYMDDLLPFYTQKWKYLLDYNEELQHVILANIENETIIQRSKDFGEPPCELDYRDVIHPKKDLLIADPACTIKTYRQMFDGKYGFTPNLSIVDLLFNKGPESIFFLME